MDTYLANFFLQDTYEAFAFLVDDGKFHNPRLDVDEKISFAFVTFIGENLAIECILDEREGDIDCKISKVIEGTKVKQYEFDGNGVRVREGLATLLRRRGLRCRLFRETKGLEFRDRVKVTLADFAHMLRTYGQDIMADLPIDLQ